MNNRSSPEKPKEPVSILALRTAKPGCEERFEAELHDFISESLQSQGQLGVSVIRPIKETGSREYGILRRFRDSTSRDRFYESPLYHQWEIKVAPLTEGEVKHRYLSGLETWFTLPGQRAIIPPPRWKMALVTFIGVYLITSILYILTMPLLSSWNFFLSNFVFNVMVVVFLTWVMMPFLTKIFADWLFVDTNK